MFLSTLSKQFCLALLLSVLSASVYAANSDKPLKPVDKYVFTCPKTSDLSIGYFSISGNISITKNGVAQDPIPASGPKNTKDGKKVGSLTGVVIEMSRKTKHSMQCSYGSTLNGTSAAMQALDVAPKQAQCKAAPADADGFYATCYF